MHCKHIGKISPMQESGQKISPIKGRVLKYAREKGISKTAFCHSVSISYENFRGKSLSSELGGDAICKILSVYSDLSAEWLLTGSGCMLKEAYKGTKTVNNIRGGNNHISNGGQSTQNNTIKDETAPYTAKRWEAGINSLISQFREFISKQDEQIRIKDEQIRAKDEQISHLLSIITSHKKG